ncbi:MAG: YSC84-related protein [Pseudomonadota bacterium]|nr:YSC84-related protein [Pseudomonadota bacterium]
MNRLLVLVFTLSSVFFVGCASMGGGSVSEQRQSILTMKTETLQKLYKLKPDVRAQISKSVGYAVFSNANINLLLASFGGGYGVVHNNSNGQNTYMKMGEVGVGLGLGAKDFRIIFVFHSQSAMDRFVNKGWAFGGQADAAAKAGSTGAAVGGELTVDNMTIYQITETGLALQATVKGTKFWKDGELN